MSENKRNIIVALFVIFGIVVLGWMVFKFGDLPAIVSRYDAREITIYFPEAPGIQENTVVQFRGYGVGKVIEVSPPEYLEDLESPEKQMYQIKVDVAISKEYRVPANVVPKVYRRGLGGSFVEFALETPASQEMLEDGDILKGEISEASEFISENTQRKLDQLISSLTDLSGHLKVQLTTMPPKVVDQGDPNVVHPNITTVVMRMDMVLKHLDVYLGDVENQQNLKKGLAEFTSLSSEIRMTTNKIGEVTEEAKKMIENASETMTEIGDFAGQANTTFQQTGQKIQEVSDNLSRTMNHLDGIIMGVSEGKGSLGLAINDPRLYESLTDVSKKLNLAVDELRGLITEVNEKGLKSVYLGK